jgi:hypothetical protein
VQTVLWGVLIVGLSVALALLGFAVVRRFVPMEFRETHNANTAVIFGALYVMYGLPSRLLRVLRLLPIR